MDDESNYEPRHRNLFGYMAQYDRPSMAEPRHRATAKRVFTGVPLQREPEPIAYPSGFCQECGVSNGQHASLAPGHRFKGKHARA